MNRSISNNVPVLDSLRAMAALSVCLFHFICTTTGFFSNETLLSIFSIGKYGVQMFFVISGFVIPWSMFHAGYKIENFFSYFLKRIVRLEPPYLFSIFIALTILYARENFMGKQNDHITVSPTQVLLHLGYLIPFFKGYQWLNQVYWTLAVEFQYYLFIALTFVPLIRYGQGMRVLLYISIVMSSFLFTGAFLFHWLPFFLLGILLFLFKSGLIKSKEFYITLVLVICFCLVKYPVAAVFYSILPIVAGLYYSKLRVWGFDTLGKFSYSIYLVHPLLGASLVNILSHYVHHPIMKILVVLTGVAFTVLSSWLMYIIIEKPSKRLSASIKYKNNE